MIDEKWHAKCPNTVSCERTKIIKVLNYLAKTEGTESVGVLPELYSALFRE